MDYSVSIDIAAPANVVWSVMSDVERWPEWTASVKRVRRLGRGPFDVGSRALINQPKFPPAVWKVTCQRRRMNKLSLRQERADLDLRIDARFYPAEDFQNEPVAKHDGRVTQIGL